MRLAGLILRLIGTIRLFAFAIIFIWVVCGKPATAIAAPPKYLVYNLGTVPGATGGRAYGINNVNQVTGFTYYGYSGSSAGTPHVFSYSSGAMQDLGAAYNGATSPGGINDGGAITGSAKSGVITRAFIFSGGNFQILGTLGGAFSYGQAINNSGSIVGAASLSNGQSRAFLYKNNSMQNLGTLGGFLSSTLKCNNGSTGSAGIYPIEGISDSMQSP